MDVEPQKEEKKVCLSRMWWEERIKDEEEYDKVHMEANESKVPQMIKFAPTKDFIEHYLRQVAEESQFHNILQNKLSVEVRLSIFPKPILKSGKHFQCCQKPRKI